MAVAGIAWMRIEIPVLATAAGLLLAACQPPPDHDAELIRLSRMMPGTYDSVLGEVPDIEHRAITMALAPIWLDRESGHWIYAEKAQRAHPARPHDQRILNLGRNDSGELFMDSYRLPDPGSVVGMWRNPERFDEYARSDLKFLAGCTIYLQRLDRNHFAGATRGRNCAATSAGAAYATVEFAIGPDGIELLERDFDGDGVQIHGPDRAQQLERR